MKIWKCTLLNAEIFHYKYNWKLLFIEKIYRFIEYIIYYILKITIIEKKYNCNETNKTNVINPKQHTFSYVFRYPDPIALF